MPDDGLGVAARVVDAFASGDALAAVSVSCFTAAACFSRVTIALFLLPFCRPPVFFPGVGVYFSSISDKFRQFNADIPGLRGHFGDVFRCSRQSQVFDAHKSREEGFRLFAVCRASRALVAAAAFGPGDIEFFALREPTKPRSLVSSGHGLTFLSKKSRAWGICVRYPRRENLRTGPALPAGPCSSR